MKTLSLRFLLVNFFLALLLCFIYETSLRYIIEDLRFDRIENQMIRNLDQNEAEFLDLFNYIEKLKREGFIDTIQWPNDTSFFYYDYFPETQQSIGPAGPVFLGVGGSRADTIQVKLSAINCVDIEDFGNEMHITFKRSSRRGYYYIFALSENINHLDWSNFIKDIEYGYYYPHNGCIQF